MPPEPDRQLPLLIYDGDCSFCKFWVEYWKGLTGSAVSSAPYQQVAPEFPEIPLSRFQAAAQFVDRDGKVSSAAEAVFRSLSLAPGKSWYLWAYEHIPGWAALCESVYAWVAGHRSGLYKLTRLFWGPRLEPPRYWLTRSLFLRLLGGIYLIAFASWWPQIPGLVGSRGILPAAGYLREIHDQLGSGGYFWAPTLAWLHPTDGFLRALGLAGAILAVPVIVGIASGPCLLLLWMLYLSQVSVGQDFMGFQWDGLLLEAGFLAVLFSPWRLRDRLAAVKASVASSISVVWLYRWLLFRFLFSSGIGKLLSRDPSWRNLTALTFHYETQPLPTVIAWYVYQLPAWFHRGTTLILFAIELGAPFLIFAPRRLRHGAACCIVSLQIGIFLTGNYTFFNLLTAALCVPLLDDARLAGLAPRKWRARLPAPPGEKPSSILRRLVMGSVAVAVFCVGAVLMAGKLTSHLPRSVIPVLRVLSPFHVVNSYGLFEVMTTKRPEIVIEGSDDGERWLAYEFRYKPGELSKPPPWVQPHQPRLDWQMWFAALGDYRSNPWFAYLVQRLLEGSPEVLKLLRSSPFPGRPPRYIRASLYDYHFTSRAERRASGAWWKREYLGTYLPPVSLR